MSTAMYEVEPIDSALPFGAVVTGLRAASLGDPTVRRGLYDLWIDRGLIVFRDLRPSDEETHVALSSVFGAPEVHPLRDPTKPGRPELSDIRYDAVFGDVTEFADGSLRGAWLPWHFDLVYVDRINHGGVLRPIVIPDEGGETGFIDQITAYDTLSEELQQRIDGLDVLYRWDMDFSRQRFGAIDGMRMVRMDPRAAKLMSRPEGHPVVVHPMVYEQRETGRKVLNVSPWFALGIAGMDGPDGDALLEEVVKHATDERGAYFHRWAADDMVLFDNFRMMHCAAGVAEDACRHMQRTTIAGDYGRGRLLDERATIDDAIRVNV